MTGESTAFEMYRSAAGERTTLPRLLAGTVLVVVLWTATTFAVIAAGTWLYVRAGNAEAGAQGFIGGFMASPAGVLCALASFAGIWIGVWAAQRFLHREPLAALIGNSRRIAWNGFAKGLAAVALTSLLTEIVIWLLYPGMERGEIGLSSWLLFLVPILLLAFLQTSSEELLFRGYLLRGLARRFRSPLVWGLLPLLAFTAMHWSASSSAAINASILVSIGAFALVLTLLVHRTGNLGAAFGAHLGNNLFGFLLISHQKSYNAFALLVARPLEGPGWTALDALAMAAVGVVACALTGLLLLHPRSPLCVRPDLGQDRAQGRT